MRQYLDLLLNLDLNPRANLNIKLKLNRNAKRNHRKPNHRSKLVNQKANPDLKQVSNLKPHLKLKLRINARLHTGMPANV